MPRVTASRTKPKLGRSPRRLPATLARLFWDYPGQTLSLDSDRELVVRRVAGEGGLREMQLLRSRVGDAAIRDVIERTEARGLSPQRIRFWQLLLRLPARSVDAWVRAARASTWAGRASGVRVSFLEYRYPLLDRSSSLEACDSPPSRTSRP